MGTCRSILFDVLVSMTDDWRKALDNNKMVEAVMLDFSKAFDMVNHSDLLKKMERYGVRGQERRWFQNYLTGRRQRVCLGEAKSGWTDIKRGVPQGSILGPLLFTIFVNDLPKIIGKCDMKQYADDTTIYRGK